MPTKTTKLNGNQNGNAKLPTAKDLRQKFKDETLTDSDKELLRISREALQALMEEKVIHGNQLETCL